MIKDNKHIPAHLYVVCIALFKWLPIFSGVALMIDCLLLLMTMRPYFMALVFGTSVTDMIALMAASYTFRFCRLHREFILYAFIISFCVDYQVVYGFGEYLLHARVCTFIYGLSLLIRLILRKGKLCGKFSCKNGK